MEETNAKNINIKPLCVDLDGTLIKTDTLIESLLILFKKQPLAVLLLPFWLMQGLPKFKKKVINIGMPDPELLPYRQDVIDYVAKEKAGGRKIILATATPLEIAQDVAEHLGLFDDIIATTTGKNLKGDEKLKAIRAHKDCINGFDYIGDSEADIPVWEGAEKALMVNPSSKIKRKVNSNGNAGEIFEAKLNSLKLLIKEIRVYQWAKNALVFVPLIMAHRFMELPLLFDALRAFLAFSFVASSVYVTNDLLDMEADRLHPRKKKRPLASGDLSIINGIVVSTVLFLGGLAIAIFTLPVKFIIALTAYIVLTTAYSFILKRIYIADIIVLAGLYTLRLISGAFAVEVPLTPWFLEFSMFLFMSLAIVKRYTELLVVSNQNKKKAKGRGYIIDDMKILISIGPASGYLAVLVFGLYIHSGENAALYDTPEILWAIVPFLLYWITRIWFMAFRGKMHDDPIIFAVKDPASYIIGLIITLLLIGAAI